jgi:heme exporter protein D
VAGVAVGSALGLAAIVGAILLVDHVQSKKKVRRVHPKSDRESREQAKEETKSEEEELKVSPRQDLLDEAPLDPESDDE